VQNNANITVQFTNTDHIITQYPYEIISNNKQLHKNWSHGRIPYLKSIYENNLKFCKFVNR